MFARAETETLREGIHCPVAARSFICFIGKFITHHRRELLHGFFFFFYMRCLSQGVKLEAASCLMIIALYVNERERRKKKRCFCFYIGREEKRERDRIKKLRFDMQWNILWQPLRRCSHWLYQEEGLFFVINEEWYEIAIYSKPFRCQFNIILLLMLWVQGIQPFSWPLLEVWFLLLGLQVSGEEGYLFV